MRLVNPFRTLKGKLLATAVLIIPGIMLFVSLVSEQAMVRVTEKGVRTNLGGVFMSARTALLKFHQQRWSDLERVAHGLLTTQAVTDWDAEGLRSELDFHLGQAEVFSELFVTDREGRVLASTHRARVGQEHERRLAFAALRGPTDRYLDGPYADPVTRELGPTTSTFHDDITLMYSMPIVVGETIRGVLHGRLPNDVQSDVLQSEDFHLYKNSGDTYLFSAHSVTGAQPGTALSRSRFEDDSVVRGDNLKDGVPLSDGGVVRVKNATELELTFKDPETNALTYAVQRIADGATVNEAGAVGYPDYRHVPVVGVGGTVQVPGSPDVWGLVAEADVAEAYAGLTESTRRFFLVGFITTLIAAAGAAMVVIRPMNQLRALMNRIRGASRSVGHASEALEQAGGSLSTSAADQASAIAETMVAVEEISAMVRRNNESAASAVQVAKAGAEDAAVGQQVVAELTGAMGAISRQNAELANVVEIINNIGEKTKVINDIVFETKLLSFNASIEAARAGEQGKGFAVVAEEVGNLARLSGRAAQEIHTLIESSTRQVQTLVAVTRDSIADGIRVGERCRESFHRINDGIASVAKMMDSIAMSNSEQQEGISQVSRAMAQMDRLTHNTSAAAAGAAGQSVALRVDGRRLADVVTEMQALIGGETRGERGGKPKASAGTTATDTESAGAPVNDGSYEGDTEDPPKYDSAAFG